MTIKHFFERRSPGDRFFRSKKFDSKTSFSIQQVFRRDTLDCWWKNKRGRRREGEGKKKKKGNNTDSSSYKKNRQNRFDFLSKGSW